MEFFGARNPFGGKKLMGGNNEWCLPQNVVITVVVIGVVVFLIYKGYIPNPMNWFKKTDAFGETQIYGVGPTASSEAGSGTYGYARALTYDNQRSPQSDLEGALVSRAKSIDLAKQAKMIKEGLADLKLEKFDPGTAIGFAKPYPEGMGNTAQKLFTGGVSSAMYGAYKVPDATRMGVTSFALRNMPETFSDMKPFIVGSNVGGLAVNPDSFQDMRIPKRSEGFVEPGMALRSRPRNLQDINPNIKDGGRSLGFQDPVQVDLKLRPAGQSERFSVAPYSKKKRFGVDNVTGVAYTTDKVRFLSTFKDSNCPCNRKVSDNPAQDSAYATEYGNCVRDNKCTIGNPIDVIYTLTEEELQMLNDMTSKYTGDQLLTTENIIVYEQALKSKDLTSIQRKEIEDLLDKARAFYKEHKKELDQFDQIIKKGLVRLKEQQFISPDYVPFNACRTTPGLIARDDQGRIIRHTKFVPKNSCDYSGYRSSINSSLRGSSDPSYACDPRTQNCKLDAVLKGVNMNK